MERAILDFRKSGVLIADKTVECATAEPQEPEANHARCCLHNSGAAYFDARSGSLLCRRSESNRSVGEGAIVAANSVVTENVSPWTVVGGNPARFIKAVQRGRDRS